jgi:hypothetical protein
VKNKRLFICFAGMLFLLSCQPVEHTFTSEELKIIDSLYQIKKDTVELEMKKRCDSIFIEKYDAIVDSLKEERRKEILDIIDE